MKQRISIFILLLSLTNLLSAGFLAGTLVKTPSGYSDIADIVEGDTVICFNFDGQCVEKRVTYVRKTLSQNIHTLIVDDETLQVSDDHEFYIPQERLWVTVHDITPGTILLANCDGYVSVNSNTLLNNSQVIYDISVEDHHNFCVSKRDIHAHNLSLALLEELLSLIEKTFSVLSPFFQWILSSPQPPPSPNQCNVELFIQKMKDLMVTAQEAYVVYDGESRHLSDKALKQYSKELYDGKEEIENFRDSLREGKCQKITREDKKAIEKEYLAMLGWLEKYHTKTIIWKYHLPCSWK